MEEVILQRGGFLQTLYGEQCKTYPFLPRVILAISHVYMAKEIKLKAEIYYCHIYIYKSSLITKVALSYLWICQVQSKNKISPHINFFSNFSLSKAFHYKSLTNFDVKIDMLFSDKNFDPSLQLTTMRIKIYLG